MPTDPLAAILRELAKLTRAVEDVAKELREARRERGQRG